MKSNHSVEPIVGNTTGAQRLQKILASFGIASRRKSEDLLREGAVTVNGKVAVLGDRAVLGVDAIKVNGKLLHVKDIEPHRYILFYKPAQLISMMEDDQGRPALDEYFQNQSTRLFPVGRLAFTSEGLLLLTNDGDLMERIIKNDNIIRIYHVKVKGHTEQALLQGLAKGARLETGFFKPERVQLLEKLQNKCVIELVCRGSGTPDLKAFCELKGLLVEKVKRVSLGQLTLGDLTPGESIALERSQVEALVAQPELGEKLLEVSESVVMKRIEKEQRGRRRQEMKDRGIHPRNIRVGGSTAVGARKPVSRDRFGILMPELDTEAWVPKSDRPNWRKPSRPVPSKGFSSGDRAHLPRPVDRAKSITRSNERPEWRKRLDAQASAERPTSRFQKDTREGRFSGSRRLMRAEEK